MLFRAMRVMKRSAERFVVGSLKRVSPVGVALVKLFILPLYRFSVMGKLRFQRLALPAQSLVLFFVTNRFLFHATLGVVTALTVVMNLQNRQAYAQDVGRHSVLFALATDQKLEIMEEAVRPEALTKNANYLGDGTILSVPHIDFDYDEGSDDVTPSIIVPGTISALPFEETPDGPRAPRTRTETYLVQENDTVSTIAHRFGVNIGTILWNNNLSARQYIRPGDTLKIPPTSGILAVVKKGDTLSKIAARYEADVQDIVSFNNITPDQQLALGTEIMVPGGSPPEIIQTRIVSRPAAEIRPSNITKPADLDSTTIPKTRLLWPTPGRVITQYYGWRHTGLDIDGDYTSPLYASADGVVEKAGWNSGGYGLQLLVDHPGGIKTRYAHASKLFVKVGDQVKRGQVIAMMGSTGRSTGTHIHYEVYVNGKRVNPLAYTK